MNEVTSPSSPDASIVRKYEVSDANPRFVTSFGLGLVALIVIAIIVVYGYFSYFSHQAKKRNRSISSIQVSQTPPLPRLQSDPTQDLRKLRAADEKRLNGLGWIDPEKRIAHIPIDRAIDLLVEQGIPEPRAPETPATGQAPQEKGTP